MMAVTGNNDDDEEKRPLLRKQHNKNNQDTGAAAGGLLVDGTETMKQVIHSILAIIILALWNIMLSVPFGSMFFSSEVKPMPMGLKKETLGLRMSLLALGIGQLIMGAPPNIGGQSGFDSLTVWTMAEVAPFYETFASLAVQRAKEIHDPTTIYPTMAYLISLSTMCIGVTFYVCGQYRIGKFLSFIPSYVILGVISGIGIWLGSQSLKLSTSSHLIIIDDNDNNLSLFRYMTPQFGLSVLLGLMIRPLRKIFPTEKFLLLDPVYFLSIPIIFYCVSFFVLRLSFDDLVQAGYMFKEPPIGSDSGTNEEPSLSMIQDTMNMWTQFEYTKIQWIVGIQAIPQLLCSSILALMVSTPFLPPIATLLDCDADFSMDREYISHGIANLLSGLVTPGGVPMMLCYSSTVLYCSSGGKGRAANVVLGLTSLLSFVYGPVWAGYLPRCMAGAILVDMGSSLFVEGIGNPLKNKVDLIEYTSIWIIALIFPFDTTAGLIAALFMSLLTTTVSSSDQDPIRHVCNASMFPSSYKHRTDQETHVLQDPITGRSNILIFQLQGSLFFGNIPKVQDTIVAYFSSLEQKKKTTTTSNSGRSKQRTNLFTPIVIFDCTLVSSFSSSACNFFDKIQTKLKTQYGVVAIVFVASPSKLGLQKASSSSATAAIEVVSPAKQEQQLPLVQNISSPSSSAGVNGASKGEGKLRRRRMSSIISHLDNVDPSHAFTVSARSTDFAGSTDRSGDVHMSNFTTRGSITSTLSPDNHHLSQVTIHGRCFASLDKALESCEDTLLSLSSMLPTNTKKKHQPNQYPRDNDDHDCDLYRPLAKEMLSQYCDVDDNDDSNNKNQDQQKLITIILDAMKCEYLPQGTSLWKFGDRSDCARLFLHGSVYVCKDEDDMDNDDEGNYKKKERCMSPISPGSFLGLRSMLLHDVHLSSVQCANMNDTTTDYCIFYTLTKDSYNNLMIDHPDAGRLLDLALARCLSHRLRHVSNRIYIPSASSTAFY